MGFDTEQVNDILVVKLQVKNLDKAKKLAEALTAIEEECGIHYVEISIKDCFLCGWVDWHELNETPMEELLRDIFTNLLEGKS